MPFETTDQEELLKRGLVRVSIAADGLEPLLDKRLKELRGALRSDAPAHQLADLMPDLERAVLAADSAREERLKQISVHLRNLLRQLQKQPVPSELTTALKKLAKRLESPIEYASCLPDLLGEVVELQSQALDKLGTEGGASGGLLSRLFGSTRESSPAIPAATPIQTPEAEAEDIATSIEVAAKDEQGEDQGVSTPENDPPGVLAGEEQHYSQVAAHIETILLNLLNELQVLDTQQSRCDMLRERVSKGLNWYELAAALDELGVLVMGAQQSRQADFERYLQQLNSRLAQFQGSLEQAHEAYSGSLDVSKSLEGAIRDQVQGLHGEVRQATDLEVLKANVENQLDALLVNVAKAQVNREEREQHVAEQMQTMVSRIQLMETEAQTFRTHLEEQRQRAMLDSLTGLANRAGLQKRMEEEFERWQRYGGQLLMVVLDVDHFKSINDRFGHLSGDKVLRLIAQQLSRRLRKSDFIGRFGGEEFVLLMPGTSLEQAETALEALRAEIEASPFHFKAERVTITISIGYTEFKAGDSLDQVFDRADRAMYKAKELGRNRLVKAD